MLNFDLIFFSGNLLKTLNTSASCVVRIFALPTGVVGVRLKVTVNQCSLLSNKMNKRLIYLLYYYLFWFLLFTVTKSVFLIYHLKETSLLPLSEILKLYGHGLKMDLSFSAYVS